MDLREDVPPVDPCLDADASHHGHRLGEPVVYVRPDLVQRHLPLAHVLSASDLGAAQTPGALHLYTLSPSLHAAEDGPFHRPSKRDATAYLLGDALGDQGSLQLGLADFLNVQSDPPARGLLE